MKFRFLAPKAEVTEAEKTLSCLRLLVLWHSTGQALLGIKPFRLTVRAPKSGNYTITPKQHSFKGDLKRKFSLMQMDSTFE